MIRSENMNNLIIPADLELAKRKEHKKQLHQLRQAL
jgi:hypothetical protein